MVSKKRIIWAAFVVTLLTVITMKLLDRNPSANPIGHEQGPTPAAILVLMDGSPAAKVGAIVAIQLAQAQSLAIRGLYVIDEGLVLDPYANYHHELAYTDDPQSRAELVNWFQQQGDYALQWLEIQCYAANVPVETEIEFGGMPDIIFRQETPAVLLSLGRQGRAQTNNGDELGHNFRAIAHRSHIPLVVGGRDQRRIKNILLVNDSGKQAQIALSWSIQLQRSLPATLTILTANKNGNNSVSLRRKLAQNGIDDYRLIFGEELSAVNILDATTISHADLVVMDGFRHNALFTKIVGSTLEKVLEQTTLPVLVT